MHRTGLAGIVKHTELLNAMDFRVYDSDGFNFGLKYIQSLDFLFAENDQAIIMVAMSKN